MKPVLLAIIAHLSSMVAFCQNAPSRPFVLGETVELHSGILLENRSLNIYLPDDYQPNDTTHYQVVYLLDGGRDEDFIHIVGLYQFNSFSWIGRVRPSIIVGITNTKRRRDMTYPTRDTAAQRAYPEAGHSDRFISFLEKELQPFVEKRFRTTTEKTLIGESLGGLLATEILLTRPALFNKYIIVSPSLWWDNGSLLERSSPIFEAGFAKPTEVYLAVGKEGLTPGKAPRVMEVDVNLLAEKIALSKSKSVKLFFDYLPEENHATIMHQAALNALRKLKP